MMMLLIALLAIAVAGVYVYSRSILRANHREVSRLRNELELQTVTLGVKVRRLESDVRIVHKGSPDALRIRHSDWRDSLYEG